MNLARTPWGPVWGAPGVVIVAIASLLGRARAAEDGRRSVAIVVTRQAGADDCPSSEELAKTVQNLAPRAVVRAGMERVARMSVHVEIERSSEGLRARMHPYGAMAKGEWRWTRELKDVGPQCRSLADAVAVTLAMLVDDDGAVDSVKAVQASPAATGPALISSSPSASFATSGPITSSDGVAASSDPVAVSSDGIAASANPIPPSSDGVAAFLPGPPEGAAAKVGNPRHELSRTPSRSFFERLAPEAGAGVASGVLAAPVPVLSGGLQYDLAERASLAIGGSSFVPDEAAIVGGKIRLALTAGWVRICGSVLGRRAEGIRLNACAWTMLGQLRGRGIGYAEDHDEKEIWPAAGAGFIAQGWLGAWVGWWSQAAAQAPLLRQGFSVDTGTGPVQVFETPLVGWQLLLGLRTRL